MFCWVPQMGRLEVFHRAQSGSQEARPIDGQNGFAGGEPVVAQNDIGSEAVGNGERKVGVITTAVSGDI